MRGLNGLIAGWLANISLVRIPPQVFDSVRHPTFDYGASGATRRLLYSEPTNRGFFTALSRQMQFAGRKVRVTQPFRLREPTLQAS